MISGFGFSGTRVVPPPISEPVKAYGPGSPEKEELKARLKSMAPERREIPVIIAGKEIRTGDLARAVMPHDHGHVLADWHRASAGHVQQAIEAALEARREWAAWPWEDRAAVFLQAAETYILMISRLSRLWASSPSAEPAPRDQRQSRFETQPRPLGQRPDDQRNLQPPARLPLPVHGRGVKERGKYLSLILI
jgi:hypothetical protein